MNLGLIFLQEVLIIPIYVPLKTNEQKVNKSAIFFFGGLLLVTSSTVCAQGKRSLADSSFTYLRSRIFDLLAIEKDTVKATLFIDIYLQKAIREKDTLATENAYYYQSQLQNNDSILINYLDSLIRVSSLKPTRNFPLHAYCFKATYYLRETQNDLALKNYLLTLQEARKFQNKELVLYIKNRIALLYRRKGDHVQAKKLDLEVYTQFQEDTTLNRDYKNAYHLALKGLYKAYLGLEEYDSASYYNRLTYDLAIQKKNELNLTGAILYEGFNQYHKGNYHATIDSIHKAMRVVEERFYRADVAKAYSYLAMSYYKLNNIPEFLTYSEKMDSISVARKITYPLQRVHYYLLLDHYKKNNDLKKQLVYLNRFIYIDSLLSTRKVMLTNILFEHISKPELLKEKQRIIRELETTLFYQKVIKYGLYGVSGLAFIFIMFQYRRRRRMKKRFEQIIESYKEPRKKKPIASKKQKVFIPKEVVERVLKGLEVFEGSRDFINPEISLQLLAYDLNTNVNYLSKIVNHYKGSSFSAYINELRIDFLFRQMKNDPEVRKYSVKQIAYYLGYTRPKYFSIIFHKITGLKPSYYIKQLEKQQV